VLCWCLARLVIRVRSSPHAHRKEGRGRGWRCRSGWNRGRRDPAEGGIVSVCTPAATASSFGSGRLARCKWAQAAVHGIWPATTQPLCLGKSKLGESKVGCYRAGASSSYARERYPVALASRRQFLFFFSPFGGRVVTATKRRAHGHDVVCHCLPHFSVATPAIIRMELKQTQLIKKICVSNCYLFLLFYKKSIYLSIYLLVDF
jgi:hypothetical protein